QKQQQQMIGSDYGDSQIPGAGILHFSERKKLLVSLDQIKVLIMVCSYPFLKGGNIFLGLIFQGLKVRPVVLQNHMATKEASQLTSKILRFLASIACGLFFVQYPRIETALEGTILVVEFQT